MTPPSKVCALLFLVAAIWIGLTGCKTAPSAEQSAGIRATIDIATGFAVQQHDTDPAVWQARAESYIAIANKLQTVNSAGNATLATLAAELQPLIAKLPPADQLAARSVVAALTPYLNQQLRDNPTVAATQVAVTIVLDEFVAAASTYVPVRSE